MPSSVLEQMLADHDRTMAGAMSRISRRYDGDRWRWTYAVDSRNPARVVCWFRLNKKTQSGEVCKFWESSRLELNMMREKSRLEATKDWLDKVIGASDNMADQLDRKGECDPDCYITVGQGEYSVEAECDECGDDYWLEGFDFSGSLTYVLMGEGDIELTLEPSYFLCPHCGVGGYDLDIAA